MKVGLVCSHGGHLTETLQLLEALEGHDVFFVTYHSLRDEEVESIAAAYFTDNIGTNPWQLLKATVWAWAILRQERPEVLVSLGAEIALPFFYWAKLLGIKTIFIESWCRIEALSKTGRLVYRVVDEFWVQWPQLVRVCDSKAEFHGAVI